MQNIFFLKTPLCKKMLICDKIINFICICQNIFVTLHAKLGTKQTVLNNINMKKQFLLPLFVLLACMGARAEVPAGAALISTRNQSMDDSSLSIVSLQRIELALSEQNQVQSVFIFEDNTSVSFDNVDAISFASDNNAVTVEQKALTGLDNATEKKIHIYPNPATEKIYFSGMNEQSRGCVINANAQRVCEINGEQTDLDVSSWPVGTYIISIDNEIFKLIKQ